MINGERIRTTLPCPVVMTMSSLHSDKPCDDILDVISKADQYLDDKQGGGVNSDSEGDVHSTSNASGVSPSTKISSSTQYCTRDDDTDSMSIARSENKAVMMWKLVFIFVLVASTVGVAIAVYLYISRQEQSEFETAFADDALKILEAVGSAFDIKMGAVDSFVSGLVSFAKASNMKWPFVVLPGFAVQASKIRVLTEAISVQQYQVIRNDFTREQWEESFVGQNEDWIQEAINLQREDPTFQGDTAIQDYKSTGFTQIRFGGPKDIVPANSGP